VVRLAYGVTAKNVLDTETGTFTADMDPCDPPFTVPLRLTDEELARITAKMEEIDSFTYPDNYVTTGDGRIAPHQAYRFRVMTNQGAKVLEWEDVVATDDKRAWNLGELIHMITRIVTARPEYKALPAPRGGYA
jgi:hypothetical protein